MTDTTPALDLDAITEKWLRQCGACDAGLGMSCTCPPDDPRNVIDALVEAVATLRRERDEARDDAKQLEEACVHNATLHNQLRKEVYRIATHAAAEDRTLGAISSMLVEALDEHQAATADRIDTLRRELAEARDALAEIKGRRILSVVFGHHKGAPRPFALYRPGRVLVALGSEFPDGAVALRLANDGGWTTKSDGGAEQFADSEVVWLSDELDSLADMERERDEAVAETTRVREVYRDANERLRLEAAKVAARLMLTANSVQGVSPFVVTAIRSSLVDCVDVLRAALDGAATTGPQTAPEGGTS